MSDTLSRTKDRLGWTGSLDSTARLRAPGARTRPADRATRTPKPRSPPMSHSLWRGGRRPRRARAERATVTSTIGAVKPSADRWPPRLSVLSWRRIGGPSHVGLWTAGRLLPRLVGAGQHGVLDRRG